MKLDFPWAQRHGLHRATTSNAYELAVLILVDQRVLEQSPLSWFLCFLR